MKLSTKGRYATRALLDLALHTGEGPILVREISQRQEVSDRYLEQILTPLKAAGLVRVIRGSRGGFLLAKPPEDIRLLDIIQVMEGSTAPVDCVDDAGLCHRSPHCATREVWTRLKASIDDVLGSATLKSLVDRHIEIERRGSSDGNS